MRQTGMSAPVLISWHLFFRPYTENSDWLLPGLVRPVAPTLGESEPAFTYEKTHDEISQVCCVAFCDVGHDRWTNRSGRRLAPVARSRAKQHYQGNGPDEV